MATPLSRIIRILNILKSKEVIFANESIPIDYAELSVTQVGLHLSKDLYVIDVEEDAVDSEGNHTTKLVKYLNVDLPQSEVYYCGLNAYRNYAISEHDEYARKAVNFKTINFAVSGLTERAKELMRIIWWCDNEIARIQSSLQEPFGHSIVMKGVE